MSTPSCAHYDDGTSDPENGLFSGGPGRCMFATRSWAPGYIPRRCAGCPDARRPQIVPDEGTEAFDYE